MCVNRELTNKEILENLGYEDIIVFENPSYEGALIGVSHNGRAIYSMEKMISCLVEEDGMTYDDAVEFIEYNTIRACDYLPDGPIVMYSLEEF